MILSENIKKILFKKLEYYLSDCRLIVSKSGDIWFLNDKTNQWYLQFSKGGTLYYYIDFFSSILPIFSIDEKDYNLILREFAYHIFESHNTTKKWKNIGKITPLSSKLENLVELITNEL